MKFSCRQHQYGAGLIEILVAVLVLSIGLISVSSMQIRSVKSNASALTHSIAVIQAQSMGDVLFIDRQAVLSGALTSDSDSNFISESLLTWQNSLVSLLGPDASGSVECVENTCSITVHWDNSRVEQGSTNQMVKVEVRL